MPTLAAIAAARSCDPILANFEQAVRDGIARASRDDLETVEHVFDARDLDPIDDLPGVEITADLRVHAMVEPDDDEVDGSVEITRLEIENVCMWVRCPCGEPVQLEDGTVLLLAADRARDIEAAALAKCGDVETFLRDKVRGR